MLGLSGLEADRGAGGNVEMHAERCGAVEVERLVCFEKMIMAADLDRTVTGVHCLDGDFLSAGVEFDVISPATSIGALTIRAVVNM